MVYYLYAIGETMIGTRKILELNSLNEGQGNVIQININRSHDNKLYLTRIA